MSDETSCKNALMNLADFFLGHNVRVTGIPPGGLAKGEVCIGPVRPDEERAYDVVYDDLRELFKLTDRAKEQMRLAGWRAPLSSSTPSHPVHRAYNEVLWLRTEAQQRLRLPRQGWYLRLPKTPTDYAEMLQAAIEALDASAAERRKEGPRDEASTDAASTESVADPTNKTPRGMSKEEASRKAWELYNADPEFKNRTAEDWAKRIGCSTGTVAKLPAWQQVMKGRRDKRESANPRQPGAVALSTEMLAARAKVDDAAEVEDTIKRIIEKATTPEEVENIRNMTPEQKRELAEVFEASREDTELSPLKDDPPPAAPNDSPEERRRKAQLRNPRTHKQA